MVKILTLFVILATSSLALAQTANVRQINLNTKDIVYDSLSRRIYASLPSAAGQNGNSIVSINPVSGSTDSTVFVGSEPGKLALSDNGQYLYVSLDGAAAVRRVQLGVQPTAGLQFSLGSDLSNGPYFVDDMFVLTGQPETLVIARRNMGFSPRHEGVAIYDDGVPRSVTTPSSSGSNVIEPSYSPNIIYGYNNESSEFGFRRMSVSASGVVVTNIFSNVISGYNVDITFDGGLIYASTGAVVEPETGTLVGTYQAGGSGFYVMTPDIRNNRVYFLVSENGGYTLKAFNAQTFLPAGQVSIPNVSGEPSRLIRWGTRGLAFRTSANQLFLIDTDLIPVSKTVSDFDGDGKTDLSVFRPSTGIWYALPSNNQQFTAMQFGSAADKIVPGDYDGDGKADIAYFRLSNGTWNILRSSDGITTSRQFGIAEDIPVQSDFDGDGKTDLSVFRPSTGIWYVLRSSDNGFTGFQYGISGDVPLKADFDDDGKNDYAVFRPSNGTWYLRESFSGNFRSFQWGINGDVPVVGDYDADGKADISVFRPSNGYWYLFRTALGVQLFNWGTSGDIPTPGDFNGDGKSDFAVFRPSNGTWYITESGNNAIRFQQFGANGDLPTMAR